MGDKKVLCFICKNEFGVFFFDDGVTERTDFEKHLIDAHQVVIPQFATYQELNEFCQQFDPFDSWQQLDRVSKFVMNQ